ncbi:MAG TPA: hypothetical protein VFJ64_11970 [Solirubrobacterales bacterium]|nr:hypothetical protein [Solirubrobacterales bacterium]
MIVLTGAAADPRSPEDPAEQLVLRLHDLPHGYFPFGPEGSDFEFICEPLDPPEPQPALAQFIRRYSPQGCMGVYLRLYRVPDLVSSSEMVGTAALDADSIQAAEAGLAVAPEILSHFTEDEIPKEATPTAAVGDATRLFHWLNISSFLNRSRRRGSLLAWRSGDVLGVVFATAGSLETSDRIAEELARRQQAHIEAPTPYTRAERDASELGLDDPALKLPVYWFGRTFRPGHALPVAHLEWGGGAPYFGGGLTGAKLKLQYSKALSLSSWTKRGWRRFLASPDGREIFAERCLTSTDVAISSGRATIYTAHVAGFRPCAARSPRRFFAVVHVGGIVVGVRLSICRNCSKPARGSYNSLAGMKAAVRGLQLRPAPEY